MDSPQPQPDRIELLAVMLVDLRATVDAQKRAVVSAQASAEEYRIGRDRQSLADINDALAELSAQARGITEGLKEAAKVLRSVRSGSESSGV